MLEHKNAPDAAAEIKAALAGMTKTIDDGLKGLSDRVDEVERKANKARLGGTPGGTPDEAALVNERKALGTFVRTGDDSEMKSMLVGSDPDGGYFVQPALSASMTKRLYDISPMRRIADVQTITVGDAFEEPLDTDEVAATWVGENEARPTTASARVGMRRVPVHEIYANQPVTQRLIDDAGFDIGAWVEGKISDKFGRSEATAFVSGNGVKKPRGFLSWDVDTAADVARSWTKLQYVLTDVATAVSADDLRNLYWALRTVHRSNGTWLMASATANSVDKLKDGNGDYLWRNGMTAGAPPSLLGRPVEFAEDMPAIATGNFPIAFGDWKTGYQIVEKVGVRYLRDPFSSKPNVLFYAYRRVGGDVRNSDAIKLMKIA
jgi:HK97 family phage major capsid protein